MIQFKGIVKRIVYESKKYDDYRILKLDDNSKEITVKGYLPCVHEGFYLYGTGDVQKSEQFGDTIILKRVEIQLPNEADTISSYLLTLMGPDVIPVGKHEETEYESSNISENEETEYEYSNSIEDEVNELFCARASLEGLCNWLGNSIIDQIENNFDYVDKCAKENGWFTGEYCTLQHLRKNLVAENELRSIASELRNVNPEYAKFTRSIFLFFIFSTELVKRYKNVLTCLKENPYAFCFHRNLPGFTFEVADAIATKYQLPKDSFDRCCAGVKHAFYTRILSEGHVYTSEERLIHESLDILDVLKEILKPHIETMYSNRILINDNESASRVYLAEYYEMEVSIAKKLVEINRQRCDHELISPSFQKIEAKLGIALSEEQKQAIKLSVNSNICLITGGPGTGKTTIIRGIIAAFEEAGECSIKLAAPTGKAAVRLKESTHYDAQTIHRLLGIKPGSSRLAVSKICDSVIIIDEASMIDIDIMDKLMYGIEFPAHLILVGDADQLPSVNPGYIFHDIIEADRFTTIRLTHIFRQEAHSFIKYFAENIINGIMLPAPVGESDYHFVAAENKEDIKKKIIENIDYFLGQGYKSKDIQVLTPVKEKICGTKDLNDILQSYFNPVTENGYRTRTEIIFTGDRVMQTQNDYNYDVFNGEITDETIVYQNQNNIPDTLEATYPPNSNKAYYIHGKYNADWVTRAYAITVHKSQGSEYPVVIMPVFSNPNLYRNLLYTAATRAKEHLVFIGFEKDLEKGIINTTPVERNTYLTGRIRYVDFFKELFGDSEELYD